MPIWCQTISWTNAGLLSMEHLGTNFSAILLEIQRFSLGKMHLKMLSTKWHPFNLTLNVLDVFVINSSLFLRWVDHIVSSPRCENEGNTSCTCCYGYPDSKVHGANMGFIWGRQDPGGPLVGPMNFAIWVVVMFTKYIIVNCNDDNLGIWVTWWRCGCLITPFCY